MKSLSKEDLTQLHKDKKISTRDFVAAKKKLRTHPSPTPQNSNKDVIKAIENLATEIKRKGDGNSILPDLVSAMTGAIKAMPSPIIKPVINNEVKMPEPIKKWKFIIERDLHSGKMSTVKVVAMK